MDCKEIREMYKLMFAEYPDIVTVKDLQIMLGISRHAAYDLLGEGEISCIRLANAYKIPKINVIDYTYHDVGLIVIDTLQKVRLSDGNGGMYANDYLNVHSLRHTNASLLISQGVDVRTVASLLGHAQASTTLDIYAHAFDKNKRKAQEKLGKAIGL